MCPIQMRSLRSAMGAAFLTLIHTVVSGDAFVDRHKLDAIIESEDLLPCANQHAGKRPGLLR